MLKKILFASFIGIVIFSFLFVGILSEPEIRSAIISHLTNDLYRQALLSKDDYTRLLRQTSDRSVIQTIALKTASLSGSRVTIIANNGTVLGDSGTPLKDLPALENHADRPEIISASGKGAGKSVRHSHTLGKDLIYLAIPLRNNAGGIIGFLRFSIPISYASDLILRFYKPILIALVAAAALAVLFSFLFARFFYAPIERLVAVSAKIAQGEIPQTILHKSRFEVGILEEAVERMSRRLADNFNKLSDERGQMAAIISNMAEGVIAINSTGRIIAINPVMEKLFGQTMPEVAGKLAREGIRNNEITGLLEDALTAGRLLEKEIDLYVPSRKHFIAHAGPIRNAQNVIIGVVCVLYDITELKKLENYRSEFVANVSHELKTPLATIHSYVQTLAGGAINDPEHNLTFLEKIDKHVLSLAALIDDILEISQLESKEGLTPFSTFNIIETANHALDAVIERIEKKKISLKKEFASADLLVRGMEDHIYRAILNLLENAITYTPDGGSIAVSCMKQDNKALISVADTGIGIPDEHLPRIFERFYRVEQSRSRQMGGTGLGLAIVKHVMNIHNGTVTIESEVGKGSKFTLIFPA
ncbi:MAG: two-component system OmpR family phosphate regulon sensor histidine kinase PhoR [Candidatus Saganbacteria bacterium]|uniref:histidine kinase n=1 Tax=Candidatus Saganbacteria bacterium TaxID=2575572 RepID=A0A833L0H1_UNCSA|nr:MAG: two-component system OmpR family phosphate regulon sensor histidine kinase PhoR [Candidatus Saganbacteria bacterium]